MFAIISAIIYVEIHPKHRGALNRKDVYSCNRSQTCACMLHFIQLWFVDCRFVLDKVVLMASIFQDSKGAGYVGWVGNFNPSTRVKLHVSNVTVRVIDEYYASYMSSYPIQLLKLQENLSKVY